MNAYKPILSALLILLFFALSGPASAQGGLESCPAVVQAALETVEGVCTGLGRNLSCYGYDRVDAVFWEPRDDLVFNAPADRVPLIDIRRIATAPLDVERDLWGVAALHVQAADLPETLPGQSVMFLLMGDVTLENAVTPEEAATPIVPVEGRTAEATNLYTIPLASANTLGSLPARTRLQLVGVDETGEWAEVLLSTGNRAWVSLSQVMVEDPSALDSLPITYGEQVAPRYGPMQAFYFTTGLAGPTCNEAPDALVIQSPANLEVAFNVNNLEVHLGSTVAFTTVSLPGQEDVRVMVVVLIEGHLRVTINGEEIILTEPGQAFAITLNEDGRVDENSQLVRLTVDPVSALMQNACQNAINAGVFERQINSALCNAEIAYYTEEGLLAAIGFPSALPALGGQPSSDGNTGLPPGPFPPQPQPVIPPFQWPQITRPQSGTALVGGGSHQVIWTPGQGASNYRLDILPDGTNLTGYTASFTTAQTSLNMPLDPIPSRPEPGWGYFMRVVPLDAAGNPLAPPDQAPMI